MNLGSGGADIRATALMLESTYGEGILGGRMSEEAAAYRNKNWNALTGLLGEYESSSDYWLLRKDGKIAWDGNSYITWEATGKRINDNALPGETASIETSLLMLLGGKDAALATLSAQDRKSLEGKSDIEVARFILQKSGAVYNEKTGTYSAPAAKEGEKGKDLSELVIFMPNPENERIYRYTNSWSSWDTYKNEKVMIYGFGNNFEKYDSLYELYMQDSRLIGYASPAQYLAENIIEMSWFGKTILTNISMQEKLKGVESGLGGKAGFDLGSIASFNPRLINNTEGTVALSEHAFGEAIDIAPGANPQIPSTTFSPERARMLKDLLGYISGKDMNGKQSTSTMFDLNRDYMKAMAEGVEGLKKRIDVEMSELNEVIQHMSYANAVANTSKIKERIDMLKTIKQSLISINYPNKNGQLFNITPSFVYVMEGHGLTWGIWNNQWDFMHFSIRGK